MSKITNDGLTLSGTGCFIAVPYGKTGPHSAADKLTYCALFDKSTNFGTEVDQHIMNKFGCGAIGQLPPGGRGGHFPKWPPADTQKLDKVRC